MSLENVKEDSGTVFKVTVRAPPFWPEEPALWFAQMEAQFDLSGITADATKFNHIIGQLEHKYAVEVKDIISNPPALKKYDKIKLELISRLSVSKEQRFLQLLKHEELGDRKPSQFLRHLRALAGEQIPEDFLKTVWSSRLPSNLKALIASQTKVSLDELAMSADQVYDIAPQSLHVHAVNSCEHVTEMSDMAELMAELAKEVASIKAQYGNQAHKSRFGSRGRNQAPCVNSRQGRSTSRPRDSPICWYHNRFGNRATRCTRPCSHPGAENFRGSRN